MVKANSTATVYFFVEATTGKIESLVPVLLVFKLYILFHLFAKAFTRTQLSVFIVIPFFCYLYKYSYKYPILCISIITLVLFPVVVLIAVSTSRRYKNSALLV